ncbi:hypothetical protein C8R45DRAFT_1101095 [Mycena sanguinolenta]|nr:hypothetical protein C8R45DRAFT_1101095 [Mycena sanguinolenta]
MPLPFQPGGAFDPKVDSQEYVQELYHGTGESVHGVLCSSSSLFPSPSPSLTPPSLQSFSHTPYVLQIIPCSPIPTRPAKAQTTSIQIQIQKPRAPPPPPPAADLERTKAELQTTKAELSASKAKLATTKTDLEALKT